VIVAMNTCFLHFGQMIDFMIGGTDEGSELPAIS
jgi:hypothetical protein